MPEPRGLLLAISFLAAIQLSAGALAHESRPVYLSLHEETPGSFGVIWKVPVGGLLRIAPAPAFPADCRATPGHAAVVKGARITSMRLRCASPLAGRVIGVSGLVENVGLSAYLKVALLDGTRAAGVLTSTSPSFTVPERTELTATAGAYARLGIMHIASGADHLLFVACLVILARGGRQLLLAITGFTLAHSLTLGLSVAGLVRLPALLVETCIALSIVFLAAEIARGTRESLATRYPVSVAGAFGLVHGFGFAGALVELGLPQGHYAAALFAFNVGVEIGQLTVIFALLLAAYCARRIAAAMPIEAAMASAALGRSAAAAAGCTAAYWVLLRVDQMFVAAV